MYIAHPTHGAGTRPNRTQPPTAARKTTLNAGQCVRQPGKAEGGTGSPPPPPPPKKNRRGRGAGENSPQPPNRRPTPPEAANPPPPPEGTQDRTPEEARGDYPAKTGNTKPGTAAHREKGHRNMQTHTTEKKKKSQQPSPKVRGWGDRDHKARDRDTQQRKKTQKKHPNNPATKGWAQPRPGRSTHAHTARRNRKRRGASGARTKPHTSQKQAETEPQPRTPRTAGTRGTTPQTVPKHTQPRPQPGLAGLTKPTPNRKPDPNTNAAQQWETQCPQPGH